MLASDNLHPATQGEPQYRTPQPRRQLTTDKKDNMSPSSNTTRRLGYYHADKKTLIGGAILFVYFCVVWSFHDGAQKSLSSMLFEYYDYDGGPKQTSYQRHNLSPINVAFGLSGDHPGFLSEFEVALKSVLLNAPMERNLHVHILADRDAFVSLDGIFNRTQLPTWVTR
ncbi:hypothetical protein ACHAXR_000278, partial [Thalassiosira sp. AJA248-18]